MAGFRVFVILVVLSVQGWAQTNHRYMVFFKDKNGTPYQVSQPLTFLSQRAVDRRNRLGLSVSPEDLPVTPSYVAQVKGLGAKTFFTSRWMNAVLVEASASVIASVAALPTVLKTELAAPGGKLLGGRTREPALGQSTASAESTDTQLTMLGLDKMHADGWHGEGVMISILDGGFIGVSTAQAFQSAFSEGRVKMTQDLVTNSGNVYQFHDHGTKVFSIISGQIPGQFTGGAYRANYLLFVTEDVSSEYRIEEYNWLFAAEKADSAGTDIIQSSLGYNLFDDASMNYKIADLDGKTSVITRAAGMARDRGIVVVVSAGNQEGWPYVSMPADTDGILAVGAVTSTGTRAGFSSYGPTADGRLKPDVAAMGQGVMVVLGNGTPGTDSGTSMAAPLVTSLAAGLLQAYPASTPSQIIEFIKQSASQGTHPDNLLGYGIPNYAAVKNYLAASQSVNDIFLFPNPVSDLMKLAFKKLPEGAVTLTFYDLQGRQLYNPVVTLDWLSNPVDIVVSNLPAGTFLLKVQTNSAVRTVRFVKL